MKKGDTEKREESDYSSQQEEKDEGWRMRGEGEYRK